jgi:hypothetical protein
MASNNLLRLEPVDIAAVVAGVGHYGRVKPIGVEQFRGVQPDVPAPKPVVSADDAVQHVAPYFNSYGLRSIKQTHYRITIDR